MSRDQWTPSVNEGQHDAYAAYRRGDYKAALRIYVSRAEQGDVAAGVNAAGMYLGGLGTDVDIDRADLLLARGVALRMPEAIYRQAYVSKLRGDASKFAEGLADAHRLGLLQATVALAACCLRGCGVPRDESRFMLLLREAASRGHIRARKMLARRVLMDVDGIGSVARGLSMLAAATVDAIILRIRAPDDERLR
jgi:TPR repeat protein